MKGTGILFMVGVMLIAARFTKFLMIKTYWILLCFFLWGVLIFISIHNKNKERNIPRPVYLAK